MLVKLFLDGEWKLSCKNKKIENIPITIPGDVHTALLRSKLILDPFFDRNEKEVEWVHFETWEIQREFDLRDISKFKVANLVLEDVDTFAKFWINKKMVLETSNMFRIYEIDVKKYLKTGKNEIRVEFRPAANEAQKLSKKLPNVVPWSEGNNQVPHMNLVRKAQFHSGWDWGPYIIPIGIYEKIHIDFVEEISVKGVKIDRQSITKEKAVVDFSVFVEKVAENLKEELKVSFAGKTQKITEINSSVVKCTFEIDNPRLWYTWDLGEQFLYDFQVFYGKERLFKKKIGLRDLKLIREKDENGVSFKFRLNGIDLFCKGANFIPIDSLPGRETSERTRKMLEDAKDANMNMLRVWGGGYFLRDFFYNDCDELGILVWQDLMFACAQYPTTDWFFEEVSKELEDQTLRLQSHPSIALWCGDNEIWRTINWTPETKDNKEFYRSEYRKLNQFLKKRINELDKNRVFWLASPSKGEDDYFEQFEDRDLSIGDSHFWNVWHGKLDFSGFLNVAPRFCSEFGFQSYPSYPCVQTFTPPDTNTLDHPAFDAHQKNKKGNIKIAEMFTKYFNAPKDFKYTLYLSQVQQAVAIQTAVEHWRQIKNICSGTLFWQLNDVWPVSSWSSVEYGGRWKQLMYTAKRFYEPQTISFSSDNETYKLHFINDLPHSADFSYNLSWITFSGNVEYEINEYITVDALKESVIWEFDAKDSVVEKTKGFIYATAMLDDGKVVSSTLFTDVYKNCEIRKPTIDVSVEYRNEKSYITLTTDVPAFFVHLEHKDVLKFSDSSFTLLPSTKKVVTCDEKISRNDIIVYHLL